MLHLSASNTGQASPRRTRAFGLAGRGESPVGVLALSLFFVLAGSGFPFSFSAAEQATIISDEVTCPECTIDFERVARLGGRNDEQGLPCGPPAATDERFYVKACSTMEILVYDHAGTLIDRFGRRGQGPGEFPGNWMQLYGMPDGGLLVVTEGRRATRVRPDLSIAQTFDQPAPLDVAVMRDGTMAQTYLHPISRTPESVGLTVHIRDQSGDLIRSIGEHHRPITDVGRQLNSLLRKIGRDRSRTKVWSAHHTRYRMELLDLDGNVEQVIVRDGWFQAWEEDASGQAVVNDLYQDEAGILWVLLTTGVDFVNDDGDKGRTFLVEAIDPAAGHVITRKEIPPIRLRMNFVGEYMWRDVTEGSHEYIEVVRLRLNS